jgi:hypothetical protein
VYGILGEEDHDAETVKVLVRRLSESPYLRCHSHGFVGCGGLLKDGSKFLRSFQRAGCQKFIVCHDADGPNPTPKYDQVMDRVIKPAEINSGYCIVIPVEEIEAWILADLPAVSKVLSSWTPDPIRQNPESIQNPRERLRRESRANNRKPIYDPGTHNARVAEHLDLHILRTRCPSFERMAKFVTGISVTPGQQAS